MLQEDELVIEDIPKWITHFGFSLILILFLFIPVFLLNYNYSFLIEGVVKKKENSLYIINIKSEDSSRIYVSQTIIFNSNNTIVSGIVSSKPYDKLNSCYFEVIATQNIINKKNKHIPIGKLFIEDGVLFYKIFKFK